MAKTFEAIQKSKVLSTENIGVGSYLTQWNSVKLQGRKSMTDILSKMRMERNLSGNKTYHFTSASVGEGTSTILVNFANFLTGDNSFKKILFVDGNIESPVFHLAFNLPLSPGLSEVINKKVEISKATHRLESSSVYIMPCGDMNVGNHISFECSHIAEVIKSFQQKFQFIVFDSPPLLVSSIAQLWADAADISFLVIQAYRTQWEIAQKAQVLLDKNNCKIGGVILNRVHYSIPQWLYKRL